MSLSCRDSCSAVLRSRSTAFKSSRMDFMASVSVCFPAASWSISSCHAFGVIASPLSFSSSGGLTSSTEIRLLLCYLVKNAGPITRQEIENALMEEALVNYFEIGSCLDDITRQQLVTLTKGSYTITEKGRKVAQELAYDLPRSVRERAVAAVLRCQTWARKEAKYSASITEKEDGHCTIRCTVKGLDSELFCLDLGTPDRLTAELVKKQFILKGNEIYQMLINKLTEEEK